MTSLKRYPSLSAPTDGPMTYSSHFYKCISSKISITSSEFFHFLSKVLKIKKHQFLRTWIFLVTWGMEPSFPSGEVCKQKMRIKEALIKRYLKHQPHTPLFCDTSAYLVPLKSHVVFNGIFYLRREIFQHAFSCKSGVSSMRKPHWKSYWR